MGVNLFQYKTLSNLGILCLIHVLNMFVLPTKLRKVESKTKNLVLFFAETEKLRRSQSYEKMSKNAKEIQSFFSCEKNIKIMLKLRKNGPKITKNTPKITSFLLK